MNESLPVLLVGIVCVLAMYWIGSQWLQKMQAERKQQELDERRRSEIRDLAVKFRATWALVVAQARRVIETSGLDKNENRKFQDLVRADLAIYGKLMENYPELLNLPGPDDYLDLVADILLLDAEKGAPPKIN